MAYLPNTETDAIKKVVYNTLEFLRQKIVALEEVGGQPNQNAFSTVAITNDSTTTNLEADTTTDTVTFEAGNGIVLTPNTSTDSVSIAVKANTYQAYRANGYVTDATLASGTNDGTVKLTVTGGDGTTSDNVKVTGWDNKVSFTNGTAVGGASQGVYVASNGTVTAMNATVGGATTPVYLNAGVVTAGTALGDAAYKGVATTLSISSTDETTVPTSKAVATLVAGAVSTADAMRFEGALDGAQANTNGGTLTPAAEKKGATYKVRTAGYINGVYCEVGDMIISGEDNVPAATWDATNEVIVNADKWIILQSNLTVTNSISTADTSMNVTTASAVASFVEGKNYLVASDLPDVTASASGTGNVLVGISASDHAVTATKGYAVTSVTQSGSGGVVTGVSYDNAGTLTVTMGSAHPTIVTTADTTSTATPAFGATFTAVDTVTRDGNGHVTTLNTKTVTIPTPKTSDVTLCDGYTSASSSIAYDSTTGVATAPQIANTDSLNVALKKLENEGNLAVSVYNAFAQFNNDNSITPSASEP